MTAPLRHCDRRPGKRPHLQHVEPQRHNEHEQKDGDEAPAAVPGKAGRFPLRRAPQRHKAGRSRGDHALTAWLCSSSCSDWNRRQLRLQCIRGDSNSDDSGGG